MEIITEARPYQKITLVLETKKEADIIWAALNQPTSVLNEYASVTPLDESVSRKMWDDFSVVHNED